MEENDLIEIKIAYNIRRNQWSYLNTEIFRGNLLYTTKLFH
jgi:hypothetical protein